jgi:hypothetical protein
MASIQLRAVRDVGGTASASKTISDANFTRIVNEHKVLLGVADADAVLEYFLDRVVKQLVANTKSREQQAASVPDIPVT